MWFRNTWSGNKKASSGYTLIEFLAVLAVVGLVMVMAWPLSQGVRDNLALRQDAEVLVRELRLARQKAITEGRECNVYFKAYTSNYEIRQGNSRRVVQLHPGVMINGTSFPFELGRSTCSFTALGNPKKGGTVYLKNSQDKWLYVPVTPVTGRVRVSPIDPK